MLLIHTIVPLIISINIEYKLTRGLFWKNNIKSQVKARTEIKKYYHSTIRNKRTIPGRQITVSLTCLQILFSSHFSVLFFRHLSISGMEQNMLFFLKGQLPFVYETCNLQICHVCYIEITTTCTRLILTFFFLSSKYRVLKHNKNVGFHQFSKVDINQNKISTIIM